MNLFDRLLSRRVKEQIYELQRDRAVAEMGYEHLKKENEELFLQVMSLEQEKRILEEHIEDLDDCIAALRDRLDAAQGKQLHNASLDAPKKRYQKESR